MKTIAVFLGLIFVCGLGLKSNGAIKFDNFQKDGYPIVIPEVKKFTPTAAVFCLPDVLTVSLPESSTVELAIIKKAISRRFPGIAVNAKRSPKAECRFLITAKDVPDSNQGYTLTIDRKGITVAARSQTGLFYGAETVAYIIRNAESRKLKGCVIRDWPSLKMRGVFFNLRFLKPGEIGKLKKTIDVLAALKYNLLVLEFADNFPLKGNPFSKRKFTLSKANIKDIVTYAKERHFKIIPHLQLLSHVRWLNTHPDFKSMIEGTPSRSWCHSYCPSKPKVKKLMLDVVTETIELLRPDYFNICFDEIALCPWRVCEKCKAKNSAELLTEHIKIFESRILELGSKPMYYHDSFYPGHPKIGGEKVLEKLDRRSAIAFWEYSIKPRENRLQYFAKRGFPTMGVTYCRNLENNPEMAKIILKNGGIGCCLTYWSFMHRFLENRKKAHNRIYPATVLGANYFWSPGGTPLYQLTYDPAYEMRRLLDEKVAAVKTNTLATSIPIVNQINAEFGSDPEFPVFSKNGNLDEIKKILAASPENFNLITTSENKYYGIRLDGNKNDKFLTGTITIPLGVKADKLSFLLTTSRLDNFYKYRDKRHWHQPHAGDIKINFADGSSYCLPLKYRFNIIDWNADCGAYDMRLLFKGADDKGSNCIFSVTDYNNPTPEKIIKSVTFSSKYNEGLSPVLLAISAFGSSKNFALPRQSEIFARAKKIVRRKNLKLDDHIYADFESGMAPAKFCKTGKCITTPTAGIVTASKNKVLKITIPPMNAAGNNVRVFVDVPIAIKPNTKSICFDYKTDSPEKIDRTRAYIGNAEDGKFNFDYNFHDSNNSTWENVRIPIKTMLKENGGCVPQKVAMMRISFWFLNRKKTVNLFLDNIGTSTADVPRRPVLAKANLGR